MSNEHTESIGNKFDFSSELDGNQNIFRILLERSPVCNKIIDTDSRLQYMSHEGVKKLKIENIESYYGTTYPSESYSESIRAPWVKALNKAEAGEISELIAPLPNHDGDLVWWKTAFIPILNEKNNLMFVLGTSVDITQEKKIEEKLKTKIEELEKLHRLFVGRELKMIELKKRLKELE